MRLFFNQFPQRLSNELEFAKQQNIQRLKVGDAGFDETVNQGTVKWAVTENGELFIIPKYSGSQEIAYTVLTLGQPTLSAGEAEIISNNGQYTLLEINNHSGHYQPDTASLQIGCHAFGENGIKLITE